MKFDVLKFLNIHLSPDLQELASEEILDSLSRYLIIRTIELLPNDQLDIIQEPENLFEYAQKNISNYSSKVEKFLEDFKQEYAKETGIN